MKFLIVVSCILAVASAGVISTAHQNTVIGAHGVPVESAENVATRAFHHAAHAKATSFHHNAAAHAAPWSEDSYNGAGNDHSAWAAPIATHVAHAEPTHPWTGPQHVPVIGHNGVPVDTHENNARRALHHNAYAAAVSRHGVYGGDNDGHQGYAAHATPIVHAEPIQHWSGPQHLPVIGHNGVPVDTQENNARRAFHHSAYAEAVARHGSHGIDQYGGQGQGYAAHATQVAYGGHAEPVHQWTGPQHIPVIGHNGVPKDTHENNARRALHHAAHAEAASRGGHGDAWNNQQDSQWQKW